MANTWELVALQAENGLRFGLCSKVLLLAEPSLWPSSGHLELW